MTAEVRPAWTTAEREAVYRLRHTVYVEQEGSTVRSAERKIRDGFDELPATTHLIALDRDRLVGAARVTLPSAAGLPTDGSLDVDPAPGRRRIAAAGMLCVDRSHRASPTLIWGLISLVHLWLVSARCSHLVGTFNPAVAMFFERAGARRLGADIVHPRLGLPSSPLLLDLDLATLDPTFRRLVRRYEVDLILRGCEGVGLSPEALLSQLGDRATEQQLLRIAARRLARPSDTDRAPAI